MRMTTTLAEATKAVPGPCGNGCSSENTASSNPANGCHAGPARLRPAAMQHIITDTSKPGGTGEVINLLQNTGVIASTPERATARSAGESMARRTFPRHGSTIAATPARPIPQRNSGAEKPTPTSNTAPCGTAHTRAITLPTARQAGDERTGRDETRTRPAPTLNAGVMLGATAGGAPDIRCRERLELALIQRILTRQTCGRRRGIMASRSVPATTVIVKTGTTRRSRGRQNIRPPAPSPASIRQRHASDDRSTRIRAVHARNLETAGEPSTGRTVGDAAPPSPDRQWNGRTGKFRLAAAGATLR